MALVAVVAVVVAVVVFVGGTFRICGTHPLLHPCSIGSSPNGDKTDQETTGVYEGRA